MLVVLVEVVVVAVSTFPVSRNACPAHPAACSVPRGQGWDPGAGIRFLDLCSLSCPGVSDTSTSTVGRHPEFVRSHGQGDVAYVRMRTGNGSEERIWVVVHGKLKKRS